MHKTYDRAITLISDRFFVKTMRVNTNDKACDRAITRLSDRFFVKTMCVNANENADLELETD